MAAANYNLLIEQGTDFRFEVTVREKNTLLPINFTGATIRGQVREDFDSSDSIDFVIDPVDLANGVFAITLHNTVTAGITYELAKYDVEVEWTTGTIDRILQGNATITKEVTK